MSCLCVQKVHARSIVPQRCSAGAAGLDLFACEDITIPRLGRSLVPTGIRIALPQNTYGRIAPRSGLALKQGIDVFAGVIDMDYRGEVGVVLFNSGEAPFSVKAGDRIAQLIITPILMLETQEVSELPTTTRGEGGFGSTGEDKIRLN